MIGKTISHYKILEKLGEGGMGVVYKAEDTKLKRFVAIKFLPPELTRDEEAKKRFIHEAQAASALDHPNICTIYEIDETEDGHMFIAMAFYEGETLKGKIERGHLTLEEAIDIAINVSKGLARAHEAGITHRDIKPANIMITKRGEVKILDFGLAKLAGQVGLTKTGTTVGTFAYMSPEQARGEIVDHRSDIWSLGVALYEMLTGQLPFKGEYEQAMMYSILNTDPELIKNLRSDVPVELEQVVLKMLKKDFAERYQQVKEILPELKAIYESEVPSSSVQQPMSAQIVPSKRRWMMITALFVLVLVVGVAILYFRKEKPASLSERKMLVVMPFENLGPPEDEYFASGITEEITSHLAAVRGLGVISRTSAVQYDRTGKTMKQIGEDLGVEYVLEGTVRWDRGAVGKSRVRVTPQLIQVSDDIHLWSVSYDRVIDDIFAVQSEIAEQVLRQLNITLLEPERRALETKPTDNLEAYDYYLRGKTHYQRRPAKEDALTAMQMFEKAVELDSDFAEAYAALSTARVWLYWGFGYKDELPKAKNALKKAQQLSPNLPEVFISAGYLYYYGSRDYEKALEQLAIAKELRPNNAEVIQVIGFIQRRQGKWEQSLTNRLKAFELEPHDYNLADGLGLTCLYMRKYPEAERYFNYAISLAPEIQTPYRQKIALYLLWDGSSERANQFIKDASGRFDPVEWLLGTGNESDLRRSILIDDYADQLGRLTLSASGTDTIGYYFVKAMVAERKNQEQLSYTYFDSARTVLEARLRASPDSDELHSLLGYTYAGLGRRDEAIREGKLAVELLPVSRDALIGPRNHQRLARIYVMVGGYEPAIDELEYLLSIPSIVSVPALKLDPIWDSLRDHPRFNKLLEGRK